MSFWRRKKFERDMEVELGFHIDAYVERPGPLRY
jgi:hypothetical protein